MFERFTERARQVVTLAQISAREAKQQIGTEHILIGLLREEDGLASTTLNKLGVTVDGVISRIGKGSTLSDDDAKGQIPFTRLGKKALELALREALGLGHNYIGTEHILLGIARLNEGTAIKVMEQIGVDADDIRSAITDALSGPEKRQTKAAQDDKMPDDIAKALAKLRELSDRAERSIGAFLGEWNK